VVQGGGQALMGTSASSRGPDGKSPLVPPWADTDGQGPGPQPDPQRFRSFRTSLGKFVSGGDTKNLRRAIGHYAGTATGGPAVGPRRFGGMARSGGALFDTLSALRDGGDARAESGVDLSGLNGQDTDVAIEAIVNALTPQDGDADRIRVAMTEALSECLEGLDEFDFAHITDDMLVDVLLAYVRNCVFEQIILDSRDAFAKAAAAGRVEQAEEDLRQLVSATTDKHMRPLLAGNIPTLHSRQVEAAQLSAIKEAWAEWEGYEP
jgi:hypothetical protein